MLNSSFRFSWMQAQNGRDSRMLALKLERSPIRIHHQGWPAWARRTRLRRSVARPISATENYPNPRTEKTRHSPLPAARLVSCSDAFRRTPEQESCLQISPSCFSPRTSTRHFRAISERGDGSPGVSRTPDLRFRKPLLYPSELQGHGRQSDELQQNTIHPRRSAGAWGCTGISCSLR